MTDAQEDQTRCPIKAWLPRMPQQRRSRERVKQILDVASELIASDGIEAFSVPRLAQQLDWPRATIYKFFPTPASMLYGLLQGYAEQLHAAADACADLAGIVDVTADSYNDPVHAAVAQRCQGIADDPIIEVLTELIATAEPTLVTPADVAYSLAATTLRGCLLHGVRDDGPIDELHRRAAAAAARACLHGRTEPALEPSAAQQYHPARA